MSQGLVQLRKLLFKGKGEVTGVVAKVDGVVVSVSSPSGLKVIENQTDVQFLVGDKVVLDGNNLLGKVSSEETIPVYFV